MIRALFISNDPARRERWIEQAGLSLALNAAVAASTREALIHLSHEAVDVIVAGSALDDGTRDDLLNDVRARHATPPIVVVGEPGEGVPLDALAHGAIEVLADDETARLGATMLRTMRDAGLGRALRAAQDELQGVLAPATGTRRCSPTRPR